MSQGGGQKSLKRIDPLFRTMEVSGIETATVIRRGSSYFEVVC
jgi:hypothetical protein